MLFSRVDIARSILRFPRSRKVAAAAAAAAAALATITSIANHGGDQDAKILKLMVEILPKIIQQGS